MPTCPIATRPTITLRAAAIAATATMVVFTSRGAPFAPPPPAHAAAPNGAWTSHGCADCIFSVAAGPDAVWAGTFGAGIVRYDLRDGSWRRFGRPEGLGGDTVRELAVGPDGDVWAIVFVGSSVPRDGRSVAHYDGNGWRVFGAAEQPWVEDLNLYSPVAAGPGGTALIAVYGPPAGGGNAAWHIARFDGAAWRLDGAPEGVDGRVRATAFGPDGRAYALVERTIRRLDAGRWTALQNDGRGPTFATADPMYDGYPLSMAIGSDGTVFVATERGVERYRESGWPEGGYWRHDALALHKSTWRTVRADVGGAAAWLTTSVDGARPALFRFDGQRWQGRTVSAPSPPNGDSVTLLPRAAVGTDGRLWLGYAKAGLAVWDGARIERRLTLDGPLTYITSAVAVSPDAHVWSASMALFDPNTIVSEFDGTRWLRHSADAGGPTANSIIGVSIGSMDAGADGRVWIGMDGGVARHDARGWTQWGAADGLPPGRAADVAADDGGRAWAATWSGIGHFDGASWRRIPAADAALPGQVHTVGVDRRPGAHAVWFGGDGAVARFDGARWQHYGADEGVPNASLIDVAVDANGTAWFSTNLVGIVTCDAARCAVLGGTNGILDGARAWGIALDAAGRPWVAQTVDSDPSRNGLLHFDGQSWVRYTTADGLLDNTVFDVAVDAAGRVWTATLAGVSAFTPPDAPPGQTPTAPPAPTDVPAAEAPKVCPQLAGRVPAAAIDAAVADPAALDGWLQPVNPNRPVGPFNARRTWLNVRKPGAAYDGVGNGLVWRGGCE